MKADNTIPLPHELAKQRVALISLAAAVGLFVFKLLVGLHTLSLGILAEAAHSALDLLATVLTWVSLRIAARPADANHPFGHGRFENFSALLQTGLLVLTALVIAEGAAQAWWQGAFDVRLDGWAFLVMVTAIAVDWSRGGMLRRAAVSYDSDALAADALNFTTDLAASAAVLVGLVLVWVGERWHISGLRHADAAAALAVAAAMLYLAIRLGRRTAGVLLDEAPPELVRDLRDALEGVEGVNDLERLRLRRVGSRYFVDLQLGLEPASTLARAGAVRREVTSRIQQRLPEADVVVEAEPRPLGPLGPLAQVQAIAQRQNLTLHDLTIYDVGSGLDVECHLEMDEALPLASAHNLVSQLEAEMRRQLPAIRQIVTHIEPALAHIDTADLLSTERIASRVAKIAHRMPEVLDCHDIQLRQSNGHLALSCHCSLPDSLPVGRVHELVTELEAEIRRGLPQLFRITIHPEPTSDNSR
ncbi:MAG: cation-efflux pump [Terriglobales bacterium]